ncbi:glycosyltransferase [Balneolaceae bacterium ANBcel3]|nr:glycosyltransferase [Balneolaceae bacterium ANBcel3]
MRILFVASGNKGNMNPLINSQKESLLHYKKRKIEIDSYLIIGKGILGYLGNYFTLRKKIKKGNYDIIHAHYLFSGILASVVGKKPIITSLMGSDIYKKYYKYIVIIFVKYFWDQSIVKSCDMAKIFSKTKVSILPNGVDISRFKSNNRFNACEALGWDSSKTHILFAASPSRLEKNFLLAKEAFNLVSRKHENLQLQILENIPHNSIPIYLNASSVVILSSKWEGSPNVIKEAMACNRPIVCTNVGDVSWLFGNEEGHYICSHDVNDFSEKLEKCINYSKHESKTNGRNRIIELQLDSDSVAKKIIAIYDKIIQ